MLLSCTTSWEGSVSIYLVVWLIIHSVELGISRSHLLNQVVSNRVPSWDIRVIFNGIRLTIYNYIFFVFFLLVINYCGTGFRSKDCSGGFRGTLSLSIISWIELLDHHRLFTSCIRHNDNRDLVLKILRLDKFDHEPTFINFIFILCSWLLKFLLKLIEFFTVLDCGCTLTVKFFGGTILVYFQSDLNFGLQVRLNSQSFISSIFLVGFKLSLGLDFCFSAGLGDGLKRCGNGSFQCCILTGELC